MYKVKTDIRLVWYCNILFLFVRIKYFSFLIKKILKWVFYTKRLWDFENTNSSHSYKVLKTQLIKIYLVCLKHFKTVI